MQCFQTLRILKEKKHCPAVSLLQTCGEAGMRLLCSPPTSSAFAASASPRPLARSPCAACPS